MGKIIDLTGMVFGRLTVIERTQSSKDGKAMWLCKCSCGNEYIAMGKLLRNGHVRSCGCLRKELAGEPRAKNLVGIRFGRLTVLDRAEDYVSPSGRHLVQWRCHCDCGSYTVTT